MFPEVLVEKRSISAALNICPDLRLTRMGPFIKNKFTNWADARLLNQPRIEKGLTPHNYQYWLYWVHERLASYDKHDPVLEYAKDLTEITGDLFKVPLSVNLSQIDLDNPHLLKEPMTRDSIWQRSICSIETKKEELF